MADAHDARFGLDLPQLTLMLYTCDAHDAGLGRCRGWQQSRLMLMMLGLCGA